MAKPIAPARVDPDLEPYRRWVLLAVGFGGAVGATARKVLGDAWPVEPGSFPWSVLAVNVVGSFVLGAVTGHLSTRSAGRPWWHPMVAAGALGSFTTMSTFLVATVELFDDGHTSTAVAYAASTLVAGLGAAWLGLNCGRFTRSGET